MTFNTQCRQFNYNPTHVPPKLHEDDLHYNESYPRTQRGAKEQPQIFSITVKPKNFVWNSCKIAIFAWVLAYCFLRLNFKQNPSLPYDTYYQTKLGLVSIGLVSIDAVFGF